MSSYNPFRAEQLDNSASSRNLYPSPYNTTPPVETPFEPSTNAGSTFISDPYYNVDRDDKEIPRAGLSSQRDLPHPRITEEEPPIYTSAPNAHHGEVMIESGPRRPFQQAPVPSHPPQQMRSNPTGFSQALNGFHAQRREMSIRGTIRAVVQDVVGQISSSASSSSSSNRANPYNQHQFSPQPTGAYEDSRWMGYPDQQHQPPPQMNTFSQSPAPPPGAVLYAPVDRRAKGRRCKQCKGRGRVKVFIFDQEVCNICGGTGRVPR